MITIAPASRGRPVYGCELRERLDPRATATARCLFALLPSGALAARRLGLRFRRRAPLPGLPDTMELRLQAEVGTAASRSTTGDEGQQSPDDVRPIPVRTRRTTGRTTPRMMGRVIEARQYLRTYDDQLRTDAETPSAVEVARLGPLRLVTFAGGRGFVTYRDLADAGAATIAAWVGHVVAHYRQRPEITRVEWKTRGHDHAPGLHDVLLRHGFAPDEPESVMIGAAKLLDVDVPLPSGVRLRTVTAESEVRAMSAMQDVAFDDPVSDRTADALLHRLALRDGMELWVAEFDGQIIGAGRLESVAGTDFAGIWGGATLQEWRGRGIYRALTAARARSAVSIGKTLIHSDSTEYSRPILERSGLIKVSTTTPYRWRR